MPLRAGRPSVLKYKYFCLRARLIIGIREESARLYIFGTRILSRINQLFFFFFLPENRQKNCCQIHTRADKPKKKKIKITKIRSNDSFKILKIKPKN